MINIDQKIPEEKMNSLQKEANSSIPEFVSNQKPKRDIKKIIITSAGLLSFFILGIAGILISQKQFLDDSITAPNAPKSEPAAYVNNISCNISFTVLGETTPTPGTGACGYSSCLVVTGCDSGLICITADDGEGYCAVEEYEEACAANPSEKTCCNELTPTTDPADPTPTSGEEEPTAVPTDGWNDDWDGGGSSSSYSESNSSAVVNITNKNNTTVSGESGSNTNGDNTTVSDESNTTEKTTTKTTTKGDQPEYPEELPQSGPEDWIQYLQVGLGVLGAGALLILFL